MSLSLSSSSGAAPAVAAEGASSTGTSNSSYNVLPTATIVAATESAAEHSRRHSSIRSGEAARKNGRELSEKAQ